MITKERVKTDPHGDQRDRVLDILRAHANHKGYVKDVDVQSIARMTGISEHDVAKQLWGLNTMGWIGFSTKKLRGHTIPYRFRLTTRGRNDTQADEASAGLGDHPAHSIIAPSKRASRIGPDVLDPATARREQLLNAGVVEVRPGAGVYRPQTAIEQGPPGRMERLMLEHAESGHRDMPPEPTGRPSPAIEPDAGTEGPMETETPKEAVPSPLRLSDFPAIEELFNRRDRMTLAEQAADLLERAGLDEQAVQAMAALTSLTDLEKEIIRFVEENG